MFSRAARILASVPRPPSQLCFPGGLLLARPRSLLEPPDPRAPQRAARNSASCPSAVRAGPSGNRSARPWARSTSATTAERARARCSGARTISSARSSRSPPGGPCSRTPRRPLLRAPRGLGALRLAARVQDRERVDALPHVLARLLAKGLLARGQIHDVVGELEGQAEPLPILLEPG